MGTNFYSLPGIRTGGSITPRNIFVSSQWNQINFVPSFYILDGTRTRDVGSSPTSLIRPGTILGKVTTGGKYRNSVIGLNTAAITATNTSITVNAAVATELARLIAAAGASVGITIAGPATTGGTMQSEVVACSAASGTTLTVGAVTNSYVTKSLIQPADGSQSPLIIFADNVFGTDVADINGASIDQALQMWLRGADLLSSQIPNLVTDDFTNTVEPSCQAYLKSFLKSGGENNVSGVAFTFDNDR